MCGSGLLDAGCVAGWETREAGWRAPTLVGRARPVPERLYLLGLGTFVGYGRPTLCFALMRGASFSQCLSLVVCSVGYDVLPALVWFCWLPTHAGAGRMALPCPMAGSQRASAGLPWSSNLISVTLSPSVFCILPPGLSSEVVAISSAFRAALGAISCCTSTRSSHLTLDRSHVYGPSAPATHYW